MSEQKPSERSYRSKEEAAMGGFNKVTTNVNYKFEEFAFWVIAKVDNGKLSFHYMTPQSNGSAHGVELTMIRLPRNHFYKAYCHTHPDSLHTAIFSTDDARLYEKLNKIVPFITFYLLAPHNELRIAENENDFPNGRTVAWRNVEP